MSLQAFSGTLSAAKRIASTVKRGKASRFSRSLISILQEEKNNSLASMQDAQLKKLHAEYLSYMNDMEVHISDAIQNAFSSLVGGTKKHTYRAAGSWAISWNDENELDDIGFLPPTGAPAVTFYKKEGSDWYPDAPVSDEGVKILGQYDWRGIEQRHNDMVTKVLRELTFTREWGKTNAKGRMLSQKTVYMYNSCPYIMEAANGSLANMETNPGALVALTIWETMSSLGATRKNNKYKHKFTMNA